MENTLENNNNTEQLQNKKDNTIIWKNIAIQLSMVIAGLVLWLISLIFALIYSISIELKISSIFGIVAFISHIEGFIFIVCGCFVFAKLFNSNNMVVAKNIKEEKL